MKRLRNMAPAKKIVNTGDVLPCVSSDEVARSLGATGSAVSKGTEVPSEKKRLEELTEEAAEHLVCLGTAAGANLGHCFYLGMKYCENFTERVIGYRQVQSDALVNDHKEHFGNQPTITVTFYGSKPQ